MRDRIFQYLSRQPRLSCSVLQLLSFVRIVLAIQPAARIAHVVVFAMYSLHQCQELSTHRQLEFHHCRIQAVS